MGAGAPLLVLVGLLVSGLGLLVQAVRQNRGLLREVRGSGQSVSRLLRDAVLLWSPLALVILLAVLAARWATDAAVEGVLRGTTLDAFCRVDGAGDAVVPCTGLDGRLPRALLRRAGTATDVDELVSARFGAARREVLRLDAAALRADRRELSASLAPRAVLGLPRAPEDDPQLLDLRAQLRRLLAAPPKPARDPLDLLRFAVEDERYAARLRALTAQVRARRLELFDTAYADVPPAQLGQLRLTHRVSHRLAAIPSQLDPDAKAALARVRAGSDDAADLARVHAGAATLLGRNEAATAARFAEDARTAPGLRTLELALAPPRRCTVAAAALDVAESVAPVQNGGTFACFALPPGDTELVLSPLGLRESVRLSIDRWHAQALADSARRLGALARGTSATRDATREFAEAIPRGIDLGRSECGLFDPAGCVANALREATEDRLAEAYADIADPAARGATTLATTAGDLDARVAHALATLDARLERMRAAAHAEAARAFLFADVLRVLGWVALALVALKSFLYVLALGVYQHEGGLTFGLEAAQAVEGPVRAARQLTIDRAFPFALITRKQLSNTNQSLRLAPWPLSAPIARLLRGRYLLYTRGTFLADAERPARGMVASASAGMSIVEWQMQPGEEVVFAYRDFFGASENVRLRTEFSLRLSTLLLGRLLFRIARCEGGEGRLLLRAHVEEIDPEHIRAIPPERLLAWHRHVRFAIHSGRTAWSTLVDGYTLVRMDRPGGPDGQIVVSSEDAGARFGSLRFVRRIFSALF